ncbi:transcription factor IBH1-like [Argentina anserina]|uniref:transcription factor IBH1-like n=1 Tax=Argentina anserina TaxID=57926 RepID=UPI002176556F|nr:transcription factor IBH1-like [Potentilla anserina]
MSTSTGTIPGGITLSTKSCRIKFARKFLRSLAQIRKQNRPSSSSSSEEETCKRSKRIKMAAYFSMARTVGPRMKWSRALLFKLRNRVSYPILMKKKKRVTTRSRSTKVSRSKGSVNIDRGNKLRKLVPGGKSMDFCNLLEETAHYITCLNTQVKVMQAIADNLSNLNEHA